MAARECRRLASIHIILIPEVDPGKRIGMSDKRANPAMPKSLPMGALEIKGAWQHREIWSIALQAIVGGARFHRCLATVILRLELELLKGSMPSVIALKEM